MQRTWAIPDCLFRPGALLHFSQLCLLPCSTAYQELPFHRAADCVAKQSPPSMKQVRHAVAILRYNRLSRLSRHAPAIEASSTRPSCSSPTCAGSPAALQSLRPGIKQMECDGQLRTAHQLLTKTAGLLSQQVLLPDSRTQSGCIAKTSRGRCRPSAPAPLLAELSGLVPCCALTACACCPAACG